MLCWLNVFAMLSAGLQFFKHGGLKSDADTTDHVDCYFDKECHSKVQWEQIGSMKNKFLDALKALKEQGIPSENADTVQAMIIRMRRGFMKAGMPENRIDYILGKWVDYVYPESLDGDLAKVSISVNGFVCDNDYGKTFVNEKYVYQGTTKDGRPHYMGTKDPHGHIYFDKYCADDTKEPRWLLGGKPDVSRDFDLNTHDGNGCHNDFSIEGSSRHLPAGHQLLTWKWCGDHGIYKRDYLSVTYNLGEATAPFLAKSMETKSAPFEITEAVEPTQIKDVIV